MTSCQAISGLEQFCRVFDVPPEIGVPIRSLFEGWVANNGEEWAVARMKDFQVNLIRYLGKEPPVYGTWTRLRKDGRPVGPIGSLFRWVSVKPTIRRRSHAISFLRMYTFLKSPCVTEKQERKFLSGVTAMPSPVSDRLKRGVVDALVRIGAPRQWVGLPKPLILASPSQSKRHPLPDGTSHPETENLFLSRMYLTETALGRKIHNDYHEIMTAVCRGMSYKKTWYGDRSFEDLPDSVGKIGLIQEPGFKLRAVANPGRVYQRALQPLGECLFRVLPSLPWDCTHNQSRPRSALLEALSDGRTLHCVDLSGATDYFPLDLQIPALDYLTFKSRSVALFQEISRSPWQYGDHTIGWTRGQPLGLLPSFASFALTHGALLFYLNDFRHDNRFFVLGDDVVILDDNLSSRYQSVLHELGCPVSPSKTLSSAHLGEFAGRVFFADTDLPQLKWREPSDESFMDFARNFGRKAFGLMRNRQRRVARSLQDVPEFLGGLGWNPNGLPLEERVHKYLNLFDRDYPHGTYLMSYNGLIDSPFWEPYNLGSSLVKASCDAQVLDMIRTFDQKVSALVSTNLPSFVNWRELLGDNLYTVAPGKLDLPLTGGTLTRRSTLETLEQKLN